MTIADANAQNPALEPQRKLASPGGGYEVYSVDSSGKRKRHQVWRDRGKAYDHIRDLKKLFGTDIQVGIREVRDVRGNLFSQAVSKCAEMLGKAAGTSIIRRRVHPKQIKIGSTKSGKVIHNDPGHESHKDFTAADHMDAYRAHAAKLSRIDRDVDHHLVAHHKRALNMHYKLGTSMQKSFAHVVADCRDLLKAAKSPGAVLGHTQSGKPVHENGNKGAKGWTAQDHMDAFHAHHEKSYEHRVAMTNHPVFKHVRENTKDYYPTPEQTMARVSQHKGDPGANQVLHHEAMSDHHGAIADTHYQAAKKKGWTKPSK